MTTGQQRKLEKQTELVARHRAEALQLDAKHAAALARLRADQELEARQLERKHRRELAQLWHDQRRKQGAWMLSALADRDGGR